MKRIRNLALIGGALALAAGIALADEVDLGKREYTYNCAACHGLGGKGDGPYLRHLADGEYVLPVLPDLTLLAKNNNGVFPSDRVHKVIDGRAELKAHGPRDMPIWGFEYNKEAAEYYHEVWNVTNAESIVRNRVRALVAYILSLQEK